MYTLSAGDRSHTVEKRSNAKTEEREEHQEFVNIDESELFLKEGPGLHCSGLCTDSMVMGKEADNTKI